MSIILEGLRKAEQKFREARSDATAGEGAKPSEKAWETIGGRGTQPDAKGKPRSSPKPRRIVTATLALLFLLAGAIAWHVWLRPAAVTTVLTQEHKANSEAHDRDVLQTLQWSRPVTLRGAIAHGLNIEMHLVREGSKLSGSYYYQRIGQDIQLRGIIEETGSMVLEEFISGRKTGMFTGKFVSGARIEGTWSKPGSTRSREFFLVSTGLLQRTPASHDQGSTAQQQVESTLGRVFDQSLRSGDFGPILPELPKNRPAP